MQRFGGQHVNESQTLLKSARNHFHTTLPLIEEKKIRKRLIVVRYELLGQFVDILTADYKYSR